MFKKNSYQPSTGTGSCKNFHTNPVVLVIESKADFWLIWSRYVPGIAWYYYQANSGTRLWSCQSDWFFDTRTKYQWIYQAQYPPNRLNFLWVACKHYRYTILNTKAWSPSPNLTFPVLNIASKRPPFKKLKVLEHSRCCSTLAFSSTHVTWKQMMWMTNTSFIFSIWLGSIKVKSMEIWCLSMYINLPFGISVRLLSSYGEVEF